MDDEQWLMAMDAVSEVVANRPPPLRVFDQVHLRAGELLSQAMRVADWAKGGSVAFIGDGDGLALSVAMLSRLGVTGPMPSMKVFDFDERVVNSVKRLAARMRLPVDAARYNCLESFPERNGFERFHAAPPIGENDDGNAAVVFARRGFEAIGYDGEGMIAAVDDPDLDWPGRVLQKMQIHAISRGFYVARMDAGPRGRGLPEADRPRSCSMVLRSVAGAARVPEDGAERPARLAEFYGRSKEPRVRYVIDRGGVGSGRAVESEYELQMWSEEG